MRGAAIAGTPRPAGPHSRTPQPHSGRPIPDPVRTDVQSAAPTEPRASEHYRPIYERRTWGDTFVHIFWILDREDHRSYQISMPANVDYKERAVQVKRDLAELTREHFERKYARFRVTGP